MQSEKYNERCKTQSMLSRGDTKHVHTQKCECADPGCNICFGKCNQVAKRVLVRVDYEDYAMSFCVDCALDALETPMFVTQDEYQEICEESRYADQEPL